MKDPVTKNSNRWCDLYDNITETNWRWLEDENYGKFHAMLIGTARHLTTFFFILRRN